MIERDVRYECRGRLDGIRGVKAPAHADFEDPGIQPGVAEHDRRRERAVLEIGQRYAVAHGFDSFERGDDGVVRDWLWEGLQARVAARAASTVDLRAHRDPLVVIDDVR